MKKNPTVVICFLYVFTFAFAMLSTWMFNSRMDEDISRVQATMKREGVAHSTALAIENAMEQTGRNVYHFVSSICFLLTNAIILVAVIAFSRITALEKLMNNDGAAAQPASSTLSILR